MYKYYTLYSLLAIHQRFMFPFTAGYVCPAGTGSVLTQCEYPEYCPEFSNMTLQCPLGYRAVNHSGIRWSIDISCNICPAGYYGNHTERAYCEICPAGYYCPEGNCINLYLE